MKRLIVMKSCLIAIVLGLSLASSVRASSLKEIFLAFVKHSGPAEFATLKKACKPSASMPIDGDADIEKALATLNLSKSVLSIRAILLIYQHCSDGAGAEDVRGFLGNEVLISQPSYLLQALSQEGADEKLAALIVRTENTEYFAVACEPTDKKCSEGRRKMWADKRRALENARVSSHLKSLKESMIRALPEE